MNELGKRLRENKRIDRRQKDRPKGVGVGGRMSGNGDGVRTLWLSVVEQAVNDVLNHNSYSRQDALKWFSSDNEEIGSYRWIRAMFDLKLSGAEIVEKLMMR